MNQNRPAGVKADRQARTVTITWADGHESRYSFAGLRAVCPCVSCKGGHAHMGTPPDRYLVKTSEDESLNLENLEAVGGYALQFSWSDGHATGIYTWEYLRQACPCSDCLANEAG